MRRKLMTTLTPVLLAAVALASCRTTWNDRDDEDWVVFAPKAEPSPMQLCEVTPLAQERQSAIETVEGADVSGWQKGKTFLAKRLKSYEARMEIAYRSMVSSCNLYANCLDRTGGFEEQCLRSEANYSEARGQFFAMVSEADNLAAEIEVARQRAIAAQARAEAARRQAEAEKTKKKKHRPGSPDGRCLPSCSTTGNIFTTDCCPVDDDDEG